MYTLNFGLLSSLLIIFPCQDACHQVGCVCVPVPWCIMFCLFLWGYYLLENKAAANVFPFASLSVSSLASRCDLELGGCSVSLSKTPFSCYISLPFSL